MRALRRLFCRLKSPLRTQRDEERLRAEIEEHLALETEANLRAGLSAVEARRQAALKFGCVEAIKESYREQRGLPFMQTLIQDSRLGEIGVRMAVGAARGDIVALVLKGALALIACGLLSNIRPVSESTARALSRCRLGYGRHI